MQQQKSKRVYLIGKFCAKCNDGIFEGNKESYCVKCNKCGYYLPKKISELVYNRLYQKARN